MFINDGNVVGAYLEQNDHYDKQKYNNDVLYMLNCFITVCHLDPYFIHTSMQKN